MLDHQHLRILRRGQDCVLIGIGAVDPHIGWHAGRAAVEQIGQFWGAVDEPSFYGISF